MNFPSSFLVIKSGYGIRCRRSVTIDNHIHPSVCIEIRHERIGTAYAENAAFRFRDVAERQRSGTVCRIIIDGSQTGPVVAVSGTDDVQCPVSVDVCQGGLSLECSGEVVGREVGAKLPFCWLI